MSTSKRGVDEAAVTPDAKITCVDNGTRVNDAKKERLPAILRGVCCTECKRIYSSPLELPPVVITSVTKNTLDKIERIACDTRTRSAEEISVYFLCRLSVPSQTELREFLAAGPTEECNISLTAARGEAARCHISPNYDWTGNKWYNLQLWIDDMPQAKSFIDAAYIDNPFVAGPAPISVWTAWGLSEAKRYHPDLSWLRFRGHKSATGYYLALCGVRFETPTSGYFELALAGDCRWKANRTNLQTEDLGLLYRVDFTLASAVQADAD